MLPRSAQTHGNCPSAARSTLGPKRPSGSRSSRSTPTPQYHGTPALGARVLTWSFQGCRAASRCCRRTPRSQQCPLRSPGRSAALRQGRAVRNGPRVGCGVLVCAGPQNRTARLRAGAEERGGARCGEGAA